MRDSTVTYPLELQRFIVDHPMAWETLLTKEPYYLTIKRSGDGRVLFKYNQIMSDFSLQICREARGIILDEGTWDIVAISFNKFFNLGEEYAADIDWDSAQIQEKADGSLFRMYFWNGRWRFSTNGSIDPATASVEFPSGGVKTFHDLIQRAFEKYTITKELNVENTYSCEICSPYNRIVVPHEDIQLFHTGTRSNVTGEEFDVDIGIPKPKQFQFGSWDELIESTKHIRYQDGEGYVVVDKDYNRVKVKAEDYLRIHRIRGEGTPSDRNLIKLIVSGTVDDFIGHFPEYTYRVDPLRNGYKAAVKALNEVEFQYYAEGWDKCTDRKRFATEFAKKTIDPSYIFKYHDGKVTDPEEYLCGLQTDKLLEVVYRYAK